MPLRTLETSEVVLYLLATTLVLLLMGVTIMHFEEHQRAEQESRYMGCKYLGRIQGLKNVYAFQCGQNVQIKQL